MIIMAFPSGNHSNRLFQNLHFEAFCKEYNIEYINPTFKDMFNYYNSPCRMTKGLKGKFFKIFKLFYRILKMFNLTKLLNIKKFDSENDNNIDCLLPPPHQFTRNIYVGGWYFRVPHLTEKYQDYFIGKYTLKNEYIINNDLLRQINHLKEKNTMVIGVHVRRGDYKTWFDGKYYFDDTVYEKYIKTLRNEIQNIYNKNCFFILFSNEQININEEENIRKSNNMWYVDHYIMSKCDLLIGPPSTFTLWASYIGKVKYYHITNDSGNISLDDFTF